MDSAAKLTSEDWHLDANCANFEHHRNFFTKIYEINQVGFEFGAFIARYDQWPRYVTDLIFSGTFTRTK